ncbi:MAG: MBL fold metallo-hydrolase [Sphingomonadales bacterium]|nr:MBL fold metallo-hydrolase [Sphingomonadales bacterium]
MSPPTVAIHGAGRTVTGSCYEIQCGDARILVDCGLFQGSRTLETLNHTTAPFDAKAIDAVILTHAHLDHSGLLPRLVARGFSGPIWTTAPTADLLVPMLADAARLQEQETMRRNRRHDRAGDPPIQAIYTMADADAALDLIRTQPQERPFTAAPGFEAVLWNAGHILGSSSAEVRCGGSRLLFSGDLGPAHKAFEPDPVAPSGLDHVFCESTYGDREREAVTIEERREILAAEIDAGLSRGGNLIIPVFALERTQELLLDLARLAAASRLKGASIFIDAPLATRITGVFSRYSRQLEDVGSPDDFDHPSFHFVDDAAESRRLNEISGSIILAGSGMCEGGRVRYHLLANLDRRDSTILFVGYQAGGTLGRTIIDGAHRVRISGRDTAVRATIRKIDSYSAHADRTELKDWILARRPISGSLFLTHGEAAAVAGLRSLLEPDIASIVAPEIGEVYELPAGAAARRIKAGRTDLHDAVESDWQNDYARFAVDLKHELQKIEAAGRRREAIERMRDILVQYRDARTKRRRKQG